MKELFSKYKFAITSVLVLIVISSIGFIVEFGLNKKSNTASIIPEEEIIKELNENIKIKEELLVEINSTLPEINDYIENSEILKNKNVEMSLKYISNDENITPDITKLGEYNATLEIAGLTYNSLLKIVDTTPPEVNLKNIAIYEGGKYNISNFIDSYSDNSGSAIYIVSYVNESDANITTPGTYYIKLNFCDESSNCKEETVTLIINAKTPAKTNPSASENNDTSKKDPINNKNNEETTSDPVVKREILNSVYYNYGVKKITYQDVTYNNENGEQIEVSRSEKKSEITFNEFNGTIESMTPEAESVYNKSEETRNTILRYTNEYRAEEGLTPLTHDRTLSILANIKAIEMAYSNKFDHYRPDGSKWDTLHKNYYKLNGMEIPYKRGENLAMGYDDADVACEVWRNSPEHYKNIIDAEFNRIGIAKYTFNGNTYYVQVFAS